MKVLHLSTGDDRGAFAAAYKTHRNLLAAGISSTMLVAQKTKDDFNVIGLNGWKKNFWRLLLNLDKILLRVFLRKEARTKHCFFFDYRHADVTSEAKGLFESGFDLIVVYYVSSFLSIDQIQHLASHFNAKVAFYLMDMGPMTGGCHYAWDCLGYVSGCKACPVTSSIHRTIIAKEFRKRQEIYEALDPIVLCGSEWLSKQAQESLLFSSMRRKKILIGLDSEIYHPRWRTEVRSKLNFSENEIVIYFGAQNIEDPRKGFPYLKEALLLLQKKIELCQLGSVRILTIGNIGDAVSGLDSYKHTHISFISNETEFAKIYSGVDLFICPSVEDSGPMMINESILSGTPVLAFKMGVAVDLVEYGRTGYLVDLKDSVGMAECLEKYINLDEGVRDDMRKSCRERAMGLTTKEKQVSAICDILDECRGT